MDDGFSSWICRCVCCVALYQWCLLIVQNLSFPPEKGPFLYMVLSLCVCVSVSLCFSFLLALCFSVPVCLVSSCFISSFSLSSSSCLSFYIGFPLFLFKRLFGGEQEVNNCLWCRSVWGFLLLLVPLLLLFFGSFLVGLMLLFCCCDSWCFGCSCLFGCHCSMVLSIGSVGSFLVLVLFSCCD